MDFFKPNSGHSYHCHVSSLKQRELFEEHITNNSNKADNQKQAKSNKKVKACGRPKPAWIGYFHGQMVLGKIN